MTNQQKAESCGEFVRDGLAVLTDDGHETCSCRKCESVRVDVAWGARQAGHWGRLALADINDDDEVYFREQERRWLTSWGDIVKTSIDRGLSAQAGGDATIAFHRAELYLSQATGYGDYR